MIEFDNLTYLHGKPQGTGLLKANPEDFVVVEDLGFEPDGEGEHILVRILKNGCNTRFVADALAKFLKIHAREVSFAGQKDKHAVTEQWLCARVPGKEMPDLSAFQLEGCQVLEYARHKRKLRLGALKGNAFTLVLREVSNRDDVEQRLIDICVKGVPNYFGAQRFGIGGSNLQGALRWAQTNTPVRDRNKRSFWLSAARSALGSLVPQLVCVVSGLGIILVFSNQFSTRVNTFRLQMHKAATGDFDITEDIGGEDEISDLYRDLKVMIDSIQELMNNVIKERVQKEQVNARQKEVEFKMLASQINPHFLYNTLETIRMQARIHNQPDIEELAKMLAKIMRRNIQVSNTLQPLKSELKLVEYYLKIQDYRFHDRIHYRIETEGDIEPLKVMPLLIQPFVENAFVHGLEAKESGGEIVIRVEVRSHLWITVTDNGCGMSMEKLDEVRRGLNDFENLDRTHIGICNVNQRIKLQYGEDYGVEFESKTGAGTKVCIKLPVLTSEIM